jgi:integrase
MRNSTTPTPHDNSRQSPSAQDGQNDLFDASSIPAPELHGCQIRPSMRFETAAAVFDDWLSSPIAPNQARYRSKNTIKDCRTKTKALNRFFGKLTLNGIHIGHIREYQSMRFSNSRDLWAHPAGANKINDELALLLRILRLGDAYTDDIRKYYQELQADESEIPKALSPEQQDRFLEVAGSRREWEIVHWYSLVALHTAFSSDELRTLRRGDINLTHNIVAVNRKAGKNKFRRREVPLTDPRCIWALDQLLERSYKLAGEGQGLYLFPFRVVRNHFNGLYPMSETGVRKQFEAVRDVANVPWFQLNGWRHTAITRMAEAGIAIATIMARAGHSSPKMTAHYTHISMQAERAAMERMMRSKVAHVPSFASAPLPQLQVDLMQPAIQAEIARQVLLALRREREQQPASVNQPQPAKGPRLIRFPGAG